MYIIIDISILNLSFNEANDVSQTARRLGILPNNLFRKLKQLNIKF